MTPKPVLFVGDNEDDRSLMRSVFAHAVIINKLLFAEGSDEAKRCLRSGNTDPSVILLEVQLRGDSASNLLQWIRSDERWNVVPVVALTTSEAGRSADRIVTPGADEYLIKPPDRAKIRQLATDLKEKFWSGGPVVNEDYLVFES